MDTQETGEAEAAPEIDAVVGSLTGFDEIAIEKHFRKDFSALSPTFTMRAMAFVVLRRRGTDDKDAHTEAMVLTLRQVKDMFGPSGGDDEGNG